MQVVKEDDKVCVLEVYETHEHNSYSICYADEKVIFTSDSYIPGCKVVTNMPHCDKALAEVVM